MSRISTLLHISDLHFVGNITEEGRSLGLKGPKTHSYAKIDALSASLFEIQWIQKRPIDIVVITGDVTTDGSQESLRTAVEFIEEDNIFRFKPKRRVVRGLGIGPSSRVVVPGNHDRYGGHFWPLPSQQSNQDLEDGFRCSSEYPYAVGFKRRNVKGDELSLIFFVFDSTLIHPSRRDYYNKIARGRIDLGECSRLKELAHEIRTTETVRGIDGTPMAVDYETALRIAVLHHHPVLPTEQTQANVSSYTAIKRRLKSGLTLMENSQAFTQACLDAKIDFVLFGHQHRGYEVELSAGGGHVTRFYCCPSTSEYSEKENGFNVIDFYTDRFEVEFYRWLAEGLKPKAFVLDRKTRTDYDRARSAARR